MVPHYGVYGRMPVNTLYRLPSVVRIM